MHITILEADASNFFNEAQSVESLCPKGQWRYFKFIDAKKVLGLFESESPTKKSLQVNVDFFKYFLGTFNPSLNENFKILQTSSFREFCTTLNSLLNSNKTVYDLSVSKKWIWTSGDTITLPKKLREFLN